MQRLAGLRWSLAVIVAGSVLSFALAAASLVIASGTAFLVSELADFAVYTPLQRRGFLIAVLASSAVGLVIDSAAFLWLAFGSLDHLAGQIVGKAWAVLAAVACISLLRQKTQTSHFSR